MRALALASIAGLIAAASPSNARVLHAPASPGAAARALATAQPGDTVLLARGVHAGPLRVERPITLRGEPGAVVDGGGRLTVLDVVSDDATVEDLALRGSGPRILTVDSGIHLRQAARVVLRRLRFSDVLYGVYAERADDLVIEDCSFTGRVQHPGI